MTNSGSSLEDAVSIRSLVGKSGTVESHVMVHVEPCADPVAALEEIWLAALREAGIDPAGTVLRRVFCRDIGGQHRALERFAREYGGAFSVVGQSPAFGEELAMWSYHVSDPGKELVARGGGNDFRLSRGKLVHVWNTNLCDPEGANAGIQTLGIMDELAGELAGQGLTLEKDVVRTWWFVRDIDTDYQALVEARKAVFEKHGLTKDTHYIASTGIEGGHSQPTAKVSLDSYAIGGLVPGQVEYLSAPAFLGPTHRYGVTFERATAVSYADRKHIFLSGTASIDPSGSIVHPGDVVRQCERAMENVAALLSAGGASLCDLAMLIVYLRNPWDAESIERTLRRAFPNLPMVLVHAPVCRPGWLVEVEGVAWVPANNPDFPEF